MARVSAVSRSEAPHFGSLRAGLLLAALVLFSTSSGRSQDETRPGGPPGVAVPGPIKVNITEWVTPTSNSVPHDTLVTPDGYIWYTANGVDKVGRFDPKTAQFKEYPLKTPKSGPHSLIDDKDGKIWFTGQSANYIGKLDPKTGEITEYPMPDPKIKGANNLLFDKNGALLFVSASSGMIGRMNIKTGEIKMVRIPGAQPRGIALNSQGIPFFSESSNNKLASFDPNTLEIKEYVLPNKDVRVRRVAITPDDAIWGSDFGRGYLIRFDPKTGKFGEWPSPSGPKSDPYAITAVGNVIWYNESRAVPSTIVRFDPATEKFQSWLVPSGGGPMHHIVPDRDGNIWIGSSGFNRIGKVEIEKKMASLQSPSPASSFRAVLDRNCVGCHNERLKAAGLMLDKADVENVPAGAEVWEKVIRKLRAGAMPPAGMPRPDQTFYSTFPAYLEKAIDTASAAAPPEPGRTAGIHRLNRAEYTNAIHDLLALDVDGETLLPPDDSGYGFDNNADVLSVSPLLLERYMTAARKISRMAIGDPRIRPESQRYNLPYMLTQEGRMSEDLPFESRGGVAVRYHFPLDGEYLIGVTMQKSESPLHAGSAVGLGEPHELEIRVDGAVVKRLTVGGEQSAAARATGAKANPHLEKGDFEVRVPIKAGTRVVGVAFVNDIVESEAESEVVLRPARPYRNLYWKFQDGDPLVESLSVKGPYDPKGPGETSSRTKILVCRPATGKSDEVCARSILATLARRAYRRPVTDADMQPLLRFYKEGRANGGFEAGIEMGLQAMLVSPGFLLRSESDPANATPGAAYRISDLELASRLSFFLWSSIPDDQLLDLAQKGKLRDRAVLEQQVRRMIADPRAHALVSNFFGQWLQLRNLDSVEPDERTFPDFSNNLRSAFGEEIDLFLESMLHEDRGLVDLLTANYTFVNDVLARHYGIPSVYGSHFRRVTLADENRWGLLGKASILALTSYPNRTSPVLRGKFVLENIMGAPPPPPPPNVPPLKENGRTGKKLTVRQLMEQHRASPACATCHARMDPLGFALDNFDATGRWRDTEADAPVDPSGTLPDGTKFQGASQLRNILASHPEQFVSTVTENLLTYALGRTLEYSDEPIVRHIVRASAADNYRWSSVILNIVSSVPFQMRKPAELAATAEARSPGR